MAGMSHIMLCVLPVFTIPLSPNGSNRWLNAKNLSYFTFSAVDSSVLVFLNTAHLLLLTLPMLRLLSYIKHKDAKIFGNHLNPVMLVFIENLSLSTVI